MPKANRGKITLCFIQPGGRKQTVAVAAGTTVMNAAVDHGVPGIDAICGGSCSCATCHVYVDAPWNRIIGPPLDDELQLLSALDGKHDDSRLGCQIKVSRAMDGMTLRIPAAT
jgi:2Fe-2S ferredoxin